MSAQSSQSNSRIHISYVRKDLLLWTTQEAGAIAADKQPADITAADVESIAQAVPARKLAISNEVVAAAADPVQFVERRTILVDSTGDDAAEFDCIAPLLDDDHDWLRERRQSLADAGHELASPDV